MRNYPRLFDEVFVRPPRKSYFKCVSSNPASREIDVTLARKQHEEYTSILRENGITVHTLPPQDQFPDSVFMQDPGLIISNLAIIGRFGVAARRGEEDLLTYDLNQRFETRRIYPEGTLEGGDILVTENGIFIGLSRRTNAEGIRQLRTHHPSLEIKAVPTELNHLLSAATYLTDRTLVICPRYAPESNFPGFKFIRVPPEELYAADTIYLGEGKVLIPQGYPKTRTKLIEAGFKPIELNISEFWKGDGALTCLSLPVHKIPA